MNSNAHSVIKIGLTVKVDEQKQVETTLRAQESKASQKMVTLGRMGKGPVQHLIDYRGLTDEEIDELQTRLEQLKGRQQ